MRRRILLILPVLALAMMGLAIPAAAGSASTPGATPTATPTKSAKPVKPRKRGKTGSTTVAGFPNLSNTGVPAGTVFTKTINGDYTVTQTGAVIDKWHIKGDLHIKAANVTIKNSQIGRQVGNEGAGYSFTITDSTVGPTSGCIIGVAVGEHNFTATRVQTRGVDDGFRASTPGNVTIRDSFSMLCGPAGSHSDGVQACCNNGRPITNVVVDHNTFDQRKTLDHTDPINLTDRDLSNVTVTNNLLAGGNYSLFLHWHSGPNWLVGGNKVVDKAWDYGPASMEGTCNHMTWGPGNAVVTIDSSYRVTSEVKSVPICKPWD